MSIKRYGIAFGIIAVTLVVPVLLAVVTALTYLQALVIQLALLAAAGAAGIAVIVVVRASLARTERRLSRAVKQTTEAVQKARGDQSRHEYHQELALERIEDLADSARAAAYGALKGTERETALVCPQSRECSSSPATARVWATSPVARPWYEQLRGIWMPTSCRCRPRP